MNLVDSKYTNLNGGGGWPGGVPDPVPLGITARYMRWEITSNWGQGIDPENTESQLCGINQVSLYKQGAYLTFYSDLMEAYGRGSYYVDSESTMTVGYRKVEVGTPLHQDLQLWNMGGYSTATSAIHITSIDLPANGQFRVEYDGAPVTSQTFPITIYGNRQDRLDVLYDPQAFGEHEDTMTIHYEHAVRGPEYDKKTFIQPFSYNGKAYDPAFGYVPIADIQGYPLGYGGFSDYTYLVRPQGAIRERPALGWLWGTRQAWLSANRGYLAQSLLQIDNSYYMIDFGEEYGAGTENGPIEELWGWAPWWYGGNPAWKNVKLYVSNDDTVWDYHPRIGPSDVDPTLTDKFDVSKWTFVKDAQFTNEHAATQQENTKNTVIPLANAPGPFRYFLILLDGPAGEGNWGNETQLSMGAIRFFQKGPELLVSPDGYDFGERTLFTTTQTQFTIGNVGTPAAGGANDIRINEVRFVTERGWEPGGKNYAGGAFFSLPDVGDLNLPKVYGPGTTETFTVEVFPTDFGFHKARVIAIAQDAHEKINAWEFEVKARVVDYATGFIRGVQATANAQYDTSNWPAQAAVDGRGIREPDGLNWDVAIHMGSKQAKHYFGGNAWLMGADQSIDDAWIECDLGAVYALDEMWLWNASWNDMNQNYGPESAIKTANIEYREDAGDAWLRLGGDDSFYTFFGLGDRMWATNPYPATNLVDGDADETNNPPVSFGGVSARYVRISTAGGPGVGSWGDSIYGICIAELRFYKRAGEARLAPAELDFGSIATNATADLTFDIENEGEAPIHVDLIAPIGAGSPYEVLLPEAPFDVPAQSAATCVVRFAPSVAGVYRDYKIAVLGDFGLLYAACHGRAFAPGAPAMEIANQAIDFGKLYMPIDGSLPPPAVRTLAIGNYGDAPLEISAVRIAVESKPAAAAAPFSVATYTPLAIPAQSNAHTPGEGAIRFAFAPTEIGTYKGYVVLTTNDPAAPLSTVTLTGVATLTKPAGLAEAEWLLYE